MRRIQAAFGVHAIQDLLDFREQPLQLEGFGHGRVARDRQLIDRRRRIAAHEDEALHEVRPAAGDLADRGARRAGQAHIEQHGVLSARRAPAAQLAPRPPPRPRMPRRRVARSMACRMAGIVHHEHRGLNGGGLCGWR
jgi:hypothetical protein